MAKQPLNVVDDVVVELDYIMRSPTGRELGRSEGAVSFIQGYGEMVPGLEDALYGMGVGEEKDVVVPPAEGFGEYDEDNLQRIPVSAFPDSVNLELGKGLRLRDRQTGEEYIGYIVDVDAEHVVLDFNHPLAGQTLHYHVRVEGLRRPTDEELEQGFVE